MKKNLKISLIVVILIVIGVTYTINKNSTSDSIKIGVISSISGMTIGGDNIGQGFANGVILAKEEYLRDNPGSSVEVVIEDDNYDAKKGISAYKKITEIDGVDALINISSPTIDVIANDIRLGEMPVLQLGAESEVLSDNIYQLYPDQTAIGVMGEIANDDGINKMTVVTQQLKAYEKFVSDFEDNFDGETEIFRISPTEKDMASLALKVKEEDSEGLLIFMGSREGAMLIKKMRDIEYYPKNLYFDLGLQLGISEYQEILGDLGYLEGSKSLFSNSDTEEGFQNRYMERFSEPFSAFSGFGYDAFFIMMDTYDKDKGKWNDNIEKYNGSGVTGEIRFDDLGIRPAVFDVATIVDGELVEIK